MSLKRIIKEVHRRSLWQVLLIYLGASWGALQVVDQVQQRLSLPPSIYGVALVLLLIGLPVVLATAFVQEAPAAAAADVAPVPAGARRVLTWRNAIGGGLLAFILGGAVLVLWLNFSPSSRREEGAADQRSIAVLPFANMSADPNDAFFADGIQDEILTHLARIAALDVRSRTSVLEYKNTTKNLKQIAHELGVRYILEGSVRRAGDATRITAQLIDAHTDKHLWANTYDGTRADVFGMQTSVAENIAKALEAELSPAERSRLAAKPTENADAHDLYLQALDYSRRSQDQSDLRSALTLARKAAELDPRYADAYAAQAEMLSQLYWFHFDRSDSIQAAARQAAARALEIDPALPEGHFATGEYLYRVKLDYEGAQKEVRRAIEAAPNEGRYVFLLAAVLRRKGDITGAVKQFERTVALDPRSSPVVQNLAETYHLLHRTEDAARTFDRAIDLLPNDLNVIYSSLILETYQTGDVARARRLLSRLDQTKATAAERAVPQAWIELLDRKPDAAIALLQSIPDSVDQTQFRFTPNSLLLGDAYETKGDAAKARSYFTRALTTIDSELKRMPDDPRVNMARGLTLSGLGQKQQAIAAAERATTLMPMAKDWWRGARLQRALAIVYMRTGEPEKAVDILQKLLNIPSDVGRGALRVDPAFDPLRSNPRFQALINQPGA